MKSASCPIAEITGNSDPEITRGETFLVECGQILRRTSSRATTMTSTDGARLKYRMPAVTSPGAASPCTCAG